MVASFLGTRKPDTQDSDFGAYYRAGAAVDAGQTPYTVDRKFGTTGAYMYAPVFAEYPFRLLSRLRYLRAVRVFMTINWIATGLVVWLCLRLIPNSKRRFPIGCVTMASAGTYLWADIHNGQVGTLLLLACLLWMTLTLAGQSFWGGVVLAIAIALKLYPMLLVPYLVLRRDVRGMIGVAVGLVLLVGAPVFVVGPAGVLPIHREWLKFCVDTQTADQTVRSGNQSLLGVLGRTPWVSDSRQRFNPAAVEKLQKVYPVVVMFGTAYIYTYILLTMYQSGWDKSRMPADVAILLLWMTLASPRCWTFNLCNEFLAVTLLAARVVIVGWRGALLSLAALIGVLVGIGLDTNDMHYPDHGWAAWAFFVQNKHFDAAVFLLGVTILVTWPRIKVENRVGPLTVLAV